MTAFCLTDEISPMADFSSEGAASVRAVCRRQRQLGRELRRFFDSVASEPVPADMTQALVRWESGDSCGPDEEGSYCEVA